VLRQVGKRESLFGTLEFDKIAVELNPAVLVLPYGEAQEDRCVAGIAFVYEPDVFWLVAQQR
jgi:hypothetical protein